MSVGEIWNSLGPFVRGAIKGTLLGGALGGAIVAIPPAWAVLGLPVFATQPYVQIEIGKVRVVFETTRSIAIDTQIELAEGKREATEETLFKWSLELSKTADVQTQGLIRARMRELEDQRRKTESQLKALYEARSIR